MSLAVTGKHEQIVTHMPKKKGGEKRRRKRKVLKSTEEAKGQELLQLQKTQGRADEKDGAGEGEMDQVVHFWWAGLGFCVWP